MSSDDTLGYEVLISDSTTQNVPDPVPNGAGACSRRYRPPPHHPARSDSPPIPAGTLPVRTRRR